MGRMLCWVPVLLALLVVPALAAGEAPSAAAPAAGGADWGGVGGHLSIGYSKLTIGGSPGGSISMAAGMDYPLSHTFRAGVDIGYDLLGSRSVQRGSLYATLDYSTFQALALLHWLPPRLWPLYEVSVGPGLVNAHADLSVTSGGAAFSDLPVHSPAAAVAVQATFMKVRPAPVKLGFELGARRAFLAGTDWMLVTARATVHY